MLCLLKSTLIVLLACHAVRSQSTTHNLEGIFKDRCKNYKKARVGSLITISDVNCDNLWTNFASAWMYKEPCGQDVINYYSLFSSLKQTLPRNKALFWSGTKDFVHRLSNKGKRYVTLEDTLIGYVVDGQTWCGQVAYPGINTMACPRYRSCQNEPGYNFWWGASEWFASQAEGEIKVVLNGSNPLYSAYDKSRSLFATVEMDNLRPNIVTKVTAFVVHDLGKAKSESCGMSSLLTLEKDVQSRNMAFECLDNPPEVQQLLESSSVGLINTDGGIERHIALLFAVTTSLFVKSTVI